MIPPSRASRRMLPLGATLFRAALLALFLPFAPFVRAQADAANLVPNGNFETPNDTGDWAASWSKPKVGRSSWEVEGGDHFIRIQSTEAGQTVLIYRQVGLRGAQAVELSIRARVSGLKKGSQAWFDARVMSNFRDAESKEIKGGGGKALSFGKDTEGWVERKVSFKVPEGAVFLALMPALFKADAGTFDLAEISLKPIDPATLVPAAK